MLKISYLKTGVSRKRVLSEVAAAKAENPNYRVIDIGGDAIGWSAPIVDMVVDINSEPSDKTMKFDICKVSEWDRLLERVARDGLYDYAICTHTLEDVYNPFTALELLPKIARAGIITMPSFITELSRIESKSYLGFIHHRWIFDKEGDEMLVVPKLSMLETLVEDTIKQDLDRDEICYEWEGSIEYCHFMNNFLGPHNYAVINEYTKFVTDRI
jgi:hypothetical protein